MEVDIIGMIILLRLLGYHGWVIASWPWIRLGSVGVGVIEESLPLSIHRFQESGLFNLVQAVD
jgi:hypothetical protein